MQVIETGMDLTANEYNYQATKIAIDQQIESEQRALQDRTAARNQKLNNDIASIKAKQASLGVEGAQGVFAGQEKTAEADIRADRINTAETVRMAQAAKNFAKTQRDIQFHKINLDAAQSFGSMGGGSSFGGFGG